MNGTLGFFNTFSNFSLFSAFEECVLWIGRRKCAEQARSRRDARHQEVGVVEALPLQPDFDNTVSRRLDEYGVPRLRCLRHVWQARISDDEPTITSYGLDTYYNPKFFNNNAIFFKNVHGRALHFFCSDTHCA